MYPTVRVAGDPLAILPDVRRIVRELEPNLPIIDVGLATDHLVRATARTRFALVALAGLAWLSVALAAGGVCDTRASRVEGRPAGGAFDQDKTVHHFLLQDAGGAIVVTSKDAADAASVSQIRAHLREIAASFDNGLFDKPLETHGEVPPGVDTMTANRARITYRYEERAGGASVVIETTDPGALTAVHDFLRYQIAEHKTGDPLTVKGQDDYHRR
jgi:hypothetical protein